MSPGNVEFCQVLAEMIVVPGLQAVIVRVDERRLSSARLARAWTPVTRDAVVFATWQFGVLFGCPALVVWFTKTRRSLLGGLLGLAAAAGLFAAALGALAGTAAAIEGLGL